MSGDSHICHVRSLKAMKSKTLIPNQICTFSKNLGISSEFCCKSTHLQVHDQGDITYGVAVLCGTSSGHLFKVRSLSASEIARMCMNPDLVAKQYGNVVVKNSRGGLQVGDFPDLSDLALLPKGLKCYYEQLLMRSSDDNIAEILSVIKSMCSVAVPINHEIFPLEDGIHEMDIKSFSNVMKTVKFNQNMVEALMLQLETQWNTADWRDGRTTTVIMELKEAVVLPRRDSIRKKRKRIDSVKSVVIWNCRGMGKAGFRNVYDYIIEFMDPDVLVLTETRVSSFIGNAVLQSNAPVSVKFHEGVGMTAGAAVITFNEDVKTRMFNSGTVSNIELRLC